MFCRPRAAGLNFGFVRVEDLVLMASEHSVRRALRFSRRPFSRWESSDMHLGWSLFFQGVAAGKKEFDIFHIEDLIQSKAEQWPQHLCI